MCMFHEHKIGQNNMRVEHTKHAVSQTPDRLRVCPKIKYLTHIDLRYTFGFMAKSMSQRKAAEMAIHERFARLNDSLSERSRRLLAASEAMAFGFGGVAAVARTTGMSSATIRKGIQESQAIASERLESLAITR